MKEEGEQIKEKRVSLKELDSFLADYEQEKSAAIIMGMYWWKNHKASAYRCVCLLFLCDVPSFQANNTHLENVTLSPLHIILRFTVFHHLDSLSHTLPNLVVHAGLTNG